MNILFLSYWGLGEGLTAATVFPHLRILSQLENIKQIVLVTIEREGYNDGNLPLIPKVIHYPLQSKRPLPNIVNKIVDFVVFPRELSSICRKENIDLIIARGAPSGALALKVSQRNSLPFTVESYEPHAEYMRETGTWRKYDPRYIFQKRWEEELERGAQALMPVSGSYKDFLIHKGLSASRIDVAPCCVDLSLFNYDKLSSDSFRRLLGIQDRICGVYAGKFGGIYYDKESFRIFKMAEEFYKGRFYLIILSSDDKRYIEKELESVKFDMRNVLIKKVNHGEVPKYLNAADFGFTLIKPKPTNLYCSPIKSGEYLAMGLPALMTSGVGDDHHILLKENAGVVFSDPGNEEQMNDCFKGIENILAEKDIKERLRALAHKYKSFSIVEEIYYRRYSAKKSQVL